MNFGKSHWSRQPIVTKVKFPLLKSPGKTHLSRSNEQSITFGWLIRVELSDVDRSFHLAVCLE